MTNEISLQDVANYLDNIGIQFLATIGLDGKPKVRPMQYMILASLLTIFCTKVQASQQIDHNNLLYQELAINIVENQKTPLVIYLHSKHASGNDNQKQLSQAGAQAIAEYLKKNKISAYFIVPQCPEEYEWDGQGGRPGCISSVEDLIIQYIRTRNIDVSRIYVCGASMGACGVWKLLKDNPKLFAAAIIASGQPQRTYPSDFTEVPLYVTVGSKERSYDALNRFISEINEIGGKVKFDVLIGMKHGEACDNAFSSQRLKWLFSQEKK